MQANMGMSGEFRCVVKRADGSTKIDTGYQKNLILNQGLDFFGGGNGVDMMAYCVIGSGNSQPIYTQNKLDTALAGINGSDVATKYDYDAARDGSLYKTNKVRKYSFTGLNNVNVSELGLASTYSNATTYFLCTRALIKGSQGNPTTITVLSGEILEIYYKLWAVYDTTDKTGTLNLLDGVGGSATYNYTVRPATVGVEDPSVGGNSFVDSLGRTVYYTYRSNDRGFYVSSSSISAITSLPSNLVSYSSKSEPDLVTNGSYTSGSYKKTLTLNCPVGKLNQQIASLFLYTSFGSWQISLKSTSDNSGFTKTSTQTLSIPIEFSWGRYEGAL